VKKLVFAALLFGISTTVAAFIPGLILTVTAISVVGFFSIYFLSLGNTILQLESEPRLRGRVMAYWSMAFLGSTAIGGPIVGWIGQKFNPRLGLGAGGVAAIAAAIIGFIVISETRRKATEKVMNAADLAADSDRRVM